MTEVKTLSRRGMQPAGFEFQSVGNQLIRVAQEGSKHIFVLLGQWEMIITYFKHALEIPLCLDPQNEGLREKHRITLTNAMGMGEFINSQTKGISDSRIEEFGFSQDFIASNLRFLRDKYEQWYVSHDKASLEADFQTICNALASADPRNLEIAT